MTLHTACEGLSASKIEAMKDSKYYCTICQDKGEVEDEDDSKDDEDAYLDESIDDGDAQEDD